MNAMNPSSQHQRWCAVAASLPPCSALCGFLVRLLAVWTLSNLGVMAQAAAPEGIYVGQFTGQSDTGGFSMIVIGGKAEVVGFNSIQDEGVYARNVTVNANGQFTGSTVQGGTFSGTVTDSGITGTFQPSSGSSGSFSGSRKSATGGLSASAGFYEGTYTGASQGSSYAILAADGSVFFYVIDNPASPSADGDGGGTGTVSPSTNVLSAVVIPSGIIINGALQASPSPPRLTGTYSLVPTPGSSIGNFQLTRTKAQPVPISSSVFNVRAAQVPGTHRVEILYDLVHSGGSAQQVSVEVSNNGGATYVVSVPAAAFSGHVGAGVSPGSNRRIVLDTSGVLQLTNIFTRQLRFKVQASLAQLSATSNLVLLDTQNPDIEKLVKEVVLGLPSTNEFVRNWDTSDLEHMSLLPAQKQRLETLERNKRGVFVSQGPELFVTEGGADAYEVHVLRRHDSNQGWTVAETSVPAATAPLFFWNDGRYLPTPQVNWSYDGTGNNINRWRFSFSDASAFRASLNNTPQEVRRSVELYKRFEFPRTVADLDKPWDNGLPDWRNRSRRLDPNAKKLVVVLHGWNRTADADPYAQDGDPEKGGFAALLWGIDKRMTEATDELSSYGLVDVNPWDLYAYEWAGDALTGNVTGNALGLPLASDSHGSGGVGVGQENGKQAAEIAYQHGLVLGKLLSQKYPDLEKIHLIAHSAGTWAARSASLYLKSRGPAGLVQQVTLLDPFNPEVGKQQWLSALGTGEHSVLDSTDINEWPGHVGGHRFENIYSDDTGVVGTNEVYWGGKETGTFSGVTVCNQKVGSSFFEIKDVSSWVGLDWDGHGGPVRFYAYSVDNMYSELTFWNKLYSFVHPLQKEIQFSKTNKYLNNVGWDYSLHHEESEALLEGLRASPEGIYAAGSPSSVQTKASSDLTGKSSVSEPSQEWSEILVDVSDNEWVRLVLTSAISGRVSLAGPGRIGLDGRFSVYLEDGRILSGLFDLRVSSPTLNIWVDGGLVFSSVQKLEGASPHMGFFVGSSGEDAVVLGIVLPDGSIKAVVEGLDAYQAGWRAAGTGSVDDDGNFQISGADGFAVQGSLDPSSGTFVNPAITPPAGIILTSIQPKNHAPSANGGTYQVQVVSTGAWAVQGEVSWLSATPPNGNGNGTVTVTVAANGSGVQRQGVLIIGGQTHTITQAGVQKASGKVVAWGGSWNGQLDVPAGLSGVTAISAGWDHTVALKADGSVVAWGNNSYGQTTVPAGLTSVTAISAGMYHTVALKVDGSVLAWGSNSYGQTVVPAGLSGVTAIAAGRDFTVALKADGSVVAWGNNSYGQTNVPAGLASVIAISAGGMHTVALKADGTIVTWGRNWSGVLDVPAGLARVTSIAAGGGHTVVLKADGNVVVWGDNSLDQTKVPAAIKRKIVKSIYAGEFLTSVLNDDGSVMAWGDNENGQRKVPAGLKRVIAVAIGGSHTVALVLDPVSLTLSQEVPETMAGTPERVGTLTLKAVPANAASKLANGSSNILPGTLVTLTAAAKSGHLFSHWEGLPPGAQVMGNIATFLMPTAALPGVAAVFVENPFLTVPLNVLGAKPVFQGILRPEDPTPLTNSAVGMLNTTLVPAKGSLSGKLWMDGLVTSFTGAMHGDGSVWFKSGRIMTPTLAFNGRELAMTWDEDGLAMTIRGPGDEVSAGLARPPLYSKDKPVRGGLLDARRRQGYYTLSLPAVAQSPVKAAEEYPQGMGCAGLTLMSNGVVKWAGTLAEGTKVTAAGYLAGGDEAEMFVVLPTPGGKTKNGSLLGTLVFDETQTDSDVNSPDMTWFRPVAESKHGMAQAYRAGWPGGIALGMFGALYDGSLPMQVGLGLGTTGPEGNAELVFEDGKLESEARVVFNVNASKVVKLDPKDKTWSFKLMPKTGMISGTFTPRWSNPSKRLPAFSGVLLQKRANEDGSGNGFFLSNRQGDLEPKSGSVILAAP